MKTMILIETEDERALVKELFANLQKDLAEGHGADMNYVDGSLHYSLDESRDVMFGSNAIVYDYRNENNDPVWDIYNFNTGKKETVEGDLAGLANAEDGNFPLF
jgi:hypothetical protein